MRLCVYCGSSRGGSDHYAKVAAGFGRVLVRSGITLVFGGGHIGLMGVVADSVLAGGGTAIGVIPQALMDRELAHLGLSELHVVDSMHDRKALMAELSDGFVALPGGAGTLDEMCEQWTWAQLGIHAKPCGFLNVTGYFDPLRAMVERMVAEGFLSPADAGIVRFEDEVEPLIGWLSDRIATAAVPAGPAPPP